MSENRSFAAGLMLLRLLALLAVLLVWPENRVWAFTVAPQIASGQTAHATPLAAWEIIPPADRTASGYPVAAEGVEGAEEAGYLYRGVSANHPALGDALEGTVTPGDLEGTITAEEHNLGGVSAQSPYTSWTSNQSIAQAFANSEGPGGVVLRVPIGAPPSGASWSWEWSPDVFGEGEVLMRGTRTGAQVLPP